MIAFLGMGNLGANFVKALIKKGNTVQVWNRTPEKAVALEEFGATAFGQLEEVVRGASRIHLTLKDDTSVDEVLEQAAPGFEPGVIILDHTTTSAEGALKRTAYWKDKGYTYLHAPVFMGPQNALESTGSMLVSGDQEVIKAVESELAAMTGKLLNLGTVVNRAAGMKLMGNLFLVAMTAGIADTLALGKALDVPVSDVAMLFESWNPAAMLPARLKKMTSNTFDQPTWELNMARKDVHLMMYEAGLAEIPLAVIPAIAHEMDRNIALGNGHLDWTVIGRDSIGKP